MIVGHVLRYVKDIVCLFYTDIKTFQKKCYFHVSIKRIGDWKEPNESVMFDVPCVRQGLSHREGGGGYKIPNWTRSLRRPKTPSDTF